MSLQNPKDVNVTDNTVSVILAGGLGNMMFQAATLMVYAKEMGYDPLIGYWTTHQSESSKFNVHLNRNGRNIHFDPWGGHILKDPHISFGDVYPQLPWFDSRPNAFNWWFDQSLGWDIDTGEGGVYYDLKQKVKPPYLFQGYFFNKLYLGDSGSYLLGLLFAIYLIDTYQINDSMSSLFIISLLWYPAFENLFSILRKIKFLLFIVNNGFH